MLISWQKLFHWTTSKRQEVCLVYFQIIAHWKTEQMVKKQKLLLYCNKSAGHQYQNSLSGFLHDEELNVKSCKITVLVMQKKKRTCAWGLWCSPFGWSIRCTEGRRDREKWHQHTSIWFHRYGFPFMPMVLRKCRELCS